MNPTTVPITGALVEQLPRQNDLLTFAQTMSPGVATALMIVGCVYLLYGIKFHKMLVTLNAAVLGCILGLKLGGGGAPVLGAVVGGFVAGAVAWALMKYAVAFTGAMFGALLGAAIWRLLELNADTVWAGALTGMIGFGLLSFVLFRGSVIMFMSMQGAVMLVFGLLGLCFKYKQLTPAIADNMQVNPYLLPALILIPMLIGLIFQQNSTASDAGGGKKK